VPPPHHPQVGQPESWTLSTNQHGKAGLSPVTDGDMTTFPQSLGGGIQSF